MISKAPEFCEFRYFEKRVRSSGWISELWVLGHIMRRVKGDTIEHIKKSQSLLILDLVALPLRLRRMNYHRYCGCSVRILQPYDESFPT